jgi:hypothetical protein
LRELRDPQQLGLAGEDERCGGERERGQAAEQDWLGADPVAERPEDGFEEHLGSVVEAEEQTELLEGGVVPGAVAAEVRGHGVRTERVTKPAA